MYRTVVTICTVEWSLYVTFSGHYTYRTVLTVYCYTPTSLHATLCSTTELPSQYPRHVSVQPDSACHVAVSQWQALCGDSACHGEQSVVWVTNWIPVGLEGTVLFLSSSQKCAYKNRRLFSQFSPADATTLSRNLAHQHILQTGRESAVCACSGHQLR